MYSWHINATYIMEIWKCAKLLLYAVPGTDVRIESRLEKGTIHIDIYNIYFLLLTNFLFSSIKKHCIIYV